MESHKFLSLLVAFVAIAYGLGRLVGAASVAPEPEVVTTADTNPTVNNNTSTGSGNVPSLPVTKPPTNQSQPAPSPAPQAKAPTQKPAAAAQPAGNTGAGARQIAAVPPPSKPRSVIGELPIEPGMPEDNGEPMEDAKASPLPKAPAGWMTSPARGADDPLVVVIVSSDFQ